MKIGDGGVCDLFVPVCLHAPNLTISVISVVDDDDSTAGTSTKI